MSNPFCYVELHTDSLKSASKFYKKIFDWKPRAVPGMGDYMTFQPKPNSAGGGMGPKQDARAPNHWLAYVEVADVKKTMAKAAKAGATVVLPFMDIGADMGTIGIFLDPSGAALGVWAKPAASKGKKKGAKKAAKKGAKKASKKASKKADTSKGKKR